MKFKTDDKVVCINNSGMDNLTMDKTYVVKRTHDDEVYLTDDSGKTVYYYSYRFKLSTGEMDLAASIALAQSFIGKPFNCGKYSVNKVIADRVVVYLPGHNFSVYGSCRAQRELKERGFSVCLNSKNGAEYPISSVEAIPESTTIKLTDAYNATIYADRVEVGCQTITKDKLVELMKEMEKL